MSIERIKEVEHSMMFLATFARSYYTFYALHEHLDNLDKNTGYLFPFRSICNALLSDAAVSWCKVFGANAEETHWKAAVGDQEEFRIVLFQELKTDKKEFHAYWRAMTDFRNNIVAHFNTDHFEGGMTPSFDLAMESSVIAHKYLREQFPSNVNYTGPLCLNKYGKEVAAAVVSKLNV